MQNKISRSLGSSNMHALSGRAIQYLSQFAMLLVVPKVLDPHAYVELNLVLPLAFLGVSMLFDWMTGSIHRHVHEFLGENGIKTRQTVFAYFALVSVVMIVIFSGLYPLIDSIYRVIPLLLVAVAHKNLILGVLNLSGNNRSYMFTNMGFAASLTVFVFLCYEWQDTDMVAKLTIYGALDIVVALVAWYKLGLGGIGLRPRFHIDVAQRYMRYGAPLVFNGIAMWVVSVSDRYILTIWEDSASIASYILDYQLGGSVIMIPMSFAVAVFLPKILSIDKEIGQDAALNYTYGLLRIYLKYAIGILIVALAVVLPLKYYVYSQYQFNYGITLFTLVLAHLVLVLAHFFNKEFELNGRTYIITKSIGLGAVVNLGFNIVLIPFMGNLGAALSTLIAYSAVVLVVCKSRQYKPNEN